MVCRNRLVHSSKEIHKLSFVLLSPTAPRLPCIILTSCLTMILQKSKLTQPIPVDECEEVDGVVVLTYVDRRTCVEWIERVFSKHMRLFC